MINYILLITYIGGTEDIVCLANLEALEKRISQLKNAQGSIKTFRVFNAATQYNLEPTWIKIPCAP